MTAHKEIEKLGGLFEHVAAGVRPFLEKCSETKYLAVIDYDRAVNEYRSLVLQVLHQSGELTSGWHECGECLNAAQDALSKEGIGSEIIGAMTELRSAFVERVLKPAVKGFLSDAAGRPNGVEGVYDKVLRLDALLDAARFLSNVRRI